MKKILIIDEDYIHLFTVQKLVLLTQKKVQISTYRSSQEAFNYLRANYRNEAMLPDVILLDLNIPGWDGWRFLDEYDKLADQFIKDVKLYVHSCSANPADFSKALRDINVCDFIKKPLTVENLNTILKRPQPCRSISPFAA